MSRKSSVVINEIELPVKTKNTTENLSMKEGSTDTNSLAHTTWNCKYHIVLAPKYRLTETERKYEKYCESCVNGKR